MLKPAVLYKEEIQRHILSHAYDDEMLLYTGMLGYGVPNFENDNDGCLYQYAILDGDKLIGYFTYWIDWHVSCVRNFGLISFDKGNKTIGIDVYRELKKIINDYRIHRIEWRMVGGNPVEKHYDRFCDRYNGKKFVLTDAIKDRYGIYHTDVIYEIVFKQKGSK